MQHLSNYTGTAVIDETGTYTYEQLNELISKYSKELMPKFDKGDVIVIESDYSFHAVALLIAMSSFPVIIIPIVRTTDQEFDDKIKASEPNKLIKISEGNIILSEIRNEVSTYVEYTKITNINDSGIVLFSSGTTGVPKVMVHDFNKLLRGFKAPRKQRSLRFLLFLLFDHIGGINTLLGCLNSGSQIVLPPDRNTGAILRTIEKYKVQVLPTSPTFLNLLSIDPNFKNSDLSSLKMITYGTEKMPVDLLKRLNALLPGVRLMQTFGTSETGIIKTKSKSSSSLYFKIIDDDIEYKIENNELIIRSKTSVNEYKGIKSDQFREDGWFATGDLVEVDEDGYIRVVGRLKEVINVGGLKVLPVEVEEVINKVPGVLDSTVLARDNAITGQMVFASVVANKSEDLSDLKKRIKKTCKEKLDKYKCPAKIEIKTELNHTTRFKKKI